MSYFSFTQVCHVCKKSMKTFKVSLSNYGENGLFLGRKEPLYFVCCDTVNFVDFEKICNPFTVQYLKNLDEIEQLNFNLMEIRMEKLKIATV